MTLSRVFFVRFFTLCLMALTFVQCQKEDIGPNDPSNPNNPNNPNNTTKTGTVNMKITDAPIDNAQIEGVFITVTEVKIDGETYENFSGKQTIDILAYQNGDVKTLGIGELEVGSYSNLTLVLDYETDAAGNAPGCYVSTTDDLKESLNASGEAIEEIMVAHDFQVEEDTQIDLVMDFDLRKTITAETDNNNQWDFSFVTDAELNEGIRIIEESEAGAVEGSCEEPPLPLFTSDKIVVYAYTEGTYDTEVEMHGQGSSDIEFANAVTSAAVQADGSYHLAFLQEGDYELVYIAYEENSEGVLQVKGQLELSVDLGINLQTVTVDAKSSTTIDVDIVGIIPL